MSNKNRVLIDAIQGVPTDPNAQDDRLNGEIMELDHSIAQNESDKRAIQRLTADKRMTQKQASTATQIIDANNAKLKKIRAELEEKQKKNKAAKQPAPDKPVVPNVQGLLFSRRVSVDQIINNALGRDQGYQCTADKPLKQVLQERFNDHLSGQAPLPPEESLKLRADLQAEFDREHPGQQSAWPAYNNDEQAYIREQEEKKAAIRTIVNASKNSGLAGMYSSAGLLSGAPLHKVAAAAQAGELLEGVASGAGALRPTTATTTKNAQPAGRGNGVAINQKSQNIKFKSGIENHLTKFDGFTQKDGIRGTHNKNEFDKAAAQHKVKIVSSTPGSSPGLTTYEYLIPAMEKGQPKLDAHGNAVYKTEIHTKTVYDPAIISDSKINNLGIEASKNNAVGYNEALNSGKTGFNSEAGGIKFRVYIDPNTGAITNYHPR